MSEKEETVTITRHFTVDMEKYAASRKTEANIPDDAEGADESDELDEAEARRMVKRLLVEGPRNEYNATVKKYGLRKLPIELDSLSCPAPDTAEGCYPAWFWGCVDDLGKVESIVAIRDVHDEVERYWLKTTTGTYLIDLGCDTAFACSGFVRVALPSCANARAYYFDPRVAAAFIEANRGALKRKNAPEEDEFPPLNVKVPTEAEAWRILAETTAEQGMDANSWERAGVVTATTWIRKNGEIIYNPAKGNHQLDPMIMQLENRIMMLNSCCWLTNGIPVGERCLKMASMARNFAEQREQHYRRLAEWIENDVAPRATAALKDMERECWKELGRHLWEGDLLRKFVWKPKAGQKNFAWRSYEAELKKLAEPIFDEYEERLNENNRLVNPCRCSDGSWEQEHVAVCEGVERWMGRDCLKTPCVPCFSPVICYKDEEKNPYFDKDDDLSMIWLAEFYYCESSTVQLSAAKCELDHGRCNAAILNAKLPYGKKLIAAALELSLKELDNRLVYEDPYPITDNDNFHCFLDQWRFSPDEFPWEKYLAMLTTRS